MLFFSQENAIYLLSRFGVGRSISIECYRPKRFHLFSESLDRVKVRHHQLREFLAFWGTVQK